MTGRAAVLLLVLAVLAVSYASSARAWLRQRGEINDLTAQIAGQQTAVDALEQEKQRWNDPAYIRTQATLRFGWVMPGETGYRVLGDDGKVLDDGASSLSRPVQAAQSGGSQWWEAAWGSVVAAGADPKASVESDEGGRTPAGHIDKNGSTDTTGGQTKSSGHQSGPGPAGTGEPTQPDGSGQTGTR